MQIANEIANENLKLFLKIAVNSGGFFTHFVVHDISVNLLVHIVCIVTAFIGEKGYKKEPQQFTNANGPDATTKIAAAGSSDNIVYDNSDSVKVQNQARTNTLTDREILDLAAGDIQVDNLDAAEADALKIFRERLDTLNTLQNERRKLGKTYKEQQFGANVDRAKAAETLEKCVHWMPKFGRRKARC